MVRNIIVHDFTIDLQNRKDAKLYSKATLGLKEDEKYDLYKEIFKNSAWNFTL